MAPGQPLIKVLRSLDGHDQNFIDVHLVRADRNLCTQSTDPFMRARIGIKEEDSSSAENKSNRLTTPENKIRVIPLKNQLVSSMSSTPRCDTETQRKEILEIINRQLIKHKHEEVTIPYKVPQQVELVKSLQLCPNLVDLNKTFNRN